MNVLGIDIGIVHLGLVLVRTNHRYVIEYVQKCDLVDITQFNCDRKTCSLHHSHSVADYMKHLFVTYEDWFETADHIVVENQPPCGITSVQEIIKFVYRDKVTIISPVSMHKYLHISDLCYEKRKEVTTECATKWLSDHREFMMQTRKHDIADAFCIVKYFLHVREMIVLSEEKMENFRKIHSGLIRSLEDFRYVP